MPQKGDRREKGGKKQVWHHELGWIPLELSGLSAAATAPSSPQPPDLQRISSPLYP